MGKALIIDTADFSGIAVGMNKIVVDKSFTNAQLLIGAESGYSNSTTGDIKAQTGYVHKIVTVEGYSTVVIIGTYPIHIGAFYNSSTNIGTSTFVSCDGALTKTNVSYITKTVTIPSGAVALSLNVGTSNTDHTLNVNT